MFTLASHRLLVGSTVLVIALVNMWAVQPAKSQPASAAKKSRSLAVSLELGKGTLPSRLKMGEMPKESWDYYVNLQATKKEGGDKLRTHLGHFRMLNAGAAEGHISVDGKARDITLTYYGEYKTVIDEVKTVFYVYREKDLTPWLFEKDPGDKLGYAVYGGKWDKHAKQDVELKLFQRVTRCSVP